MNNSETVRRSKRNETKIKEANKKNALNKEKYDKSTERNPEVSFSSDTKDDTEEKEESVLQEEKDEEPSSSSQKKKSNNSAANNADINRVKDIVKEIEIILDKLFSVDISQVPMGSNVRVSVLSEKPTETHVLEEQNINIG
jgi:hypothetical protein